MTKLKIILPEELAKKAEEHLEINWVSIASNAIKEYVKNILSRIS
jgi:hypothetical protein